jgi:hypothetical protein
MRNFYDYPMKNDPTLAAEVEAIRNKIDDRSASKTINPEALSEIDRVIYEEFLNLFTITDQELKTMYIEGEYSPHFAAQSVANAMGLEAYIARDGTVLRVSLPGQLLVDYPIEEDYR